ncbi:hypothetical protein [Clostridium sp.]|uniref:hypothetical protein n=1 Tax=Clostridium sp. TaxID=1506 RepID=UPI003D6CA254
MRHTHQRNTKIVTELMGYCYNHGSENIHIDINKEKEKVVIFIKAKISSITKEDLELLDRSLNAQRCHEMEEYYWNLTGDNDSYSELILVGMMIDEAHINYINGEYLEILLTRIP